MVPTSTETVYLRGESKAKDKPTGWLATRTECSDTRVEDRWASSWAQDEREKKGYGEAIRSILKTSAGNGTGREEATVDEALPGSPGAG